MAQQEPLECTVELRGDIYVTVDPGGSCHPTTGWELYLWQAARAEPAQPVDPNYCMSKPLGFGIAPAQAESHTGIYCPSCGTAIAARWLTQNDVQEPPVQLSLDLDTP
jgi:hypothetical protein